MSALGLYAGCYVKLRNGEICGPLTYDGSFPITDWPWKCDDFSWRRDGSTCRFPGEHELDIVSVMSPSFARYVQEYMAPAEPAIKDAGVPEHVLAAAREAGLKAVPTYDLFVQAVVEAAFEAERNGAKPMPALINGLRFQGELAVKLMTTTRLNPEESQIVARVALDVLLEITGSGQVKNESAPGSDALRKTEGGQSDPVKRQRQVYPFSPLDPKGSATSSKGASNVGN